MTMVFSFMLLIASGKPQSSMSGQGAPEQKNASGSSTLTTVSFEKMGRLAKQGDQLFLAYGKKKYHPRNDINRLEEEGRISIIIGVDGSEKKILYLEEGRNNAVLLSEYLSAFQYLSRQGIGVAFAKRVK
jgi:hypothetical protein